MYLDAVGHRCLKAIATIKPMVRIFTYLGACTAEEYPNTGKAGTCQNKTCAFKISNYYTVNTCDSLAAAIMVEPVSVAVDASKWSVYSSGVFTNCGTALNHMVLLTGMAD